MKVHETALEGVLLIEPEVFADDRGYFLETFQSSKYQELAGIDLPFVQDNYSRSRRDVLRGLHAQKQHPQGKLVHCTRGAVWDVAADIDPDSATFGQWVGFELSDQNHLQLWIPPGYLHGFVVLSEEADFVYKCTDFYRPEDELSIIWNDPTLAIDWPINTPQVSDKDQQNKRLSELIG